VLVYSCQTRRQSILAWENSTPLDSLRSVPCTRTLDPVLFQVPRVHSWLDYWHSHSV
jgi:hypothetical protein